MLGTRNVAVPNIRFFRGQHLRSMKNEVCLGIVPPSRFDMADPAFRFLSDEDRKQSSRL